MTEQNTTKMSVDELTADNIPEILPDLYKKIFDKGRAEGEKSERDMFAELRKICGEDKSLLVQCLAEGKNAAEASQMRMDGLQAEAKKLAEENAALKTKGIDPARAEFSNQPTAPAASDKFDESKTTDEQLKEH
jgi:hypothetical protein